MTEAGFQIQPVRSAADLDATIQLFNAYASQLGIDLGFQGFAAELAAMPGPYAEPSGILLLARDKPGQPIGCVGLRPLPRTGCCEMKRLYVAPHGRGLGLGTALIAAIIQAARRIGYHEMRLDTLPDMQAARALYRQAGFSPTAPYYDTPIAGTTFLARTLTA